MTTTNGDPGRRRRRPLRIWAHSGGDVRRAGGIVAAALALLFAFTFLYVAAFHAPRAKGYDVGVVGAPDVAARVQGALDASDRGAFDVRRFPAEAPARAALLDTDVHGVLVPGSAGDRVLVAGALGPNATETVRDALRRVAARPLVEDLRPLPSGDRRGLSSLFTVIGTVMPSLVLHGLARDGGRAGIVVANLVLVLLGLSASGGAIGWEFEPGFYGAVSQLLPPGAAVTAVRDVTYFDWAGTLAPLLVLGAWAAGGIVIGLAADLRRPRARAAVSRPVDVPSPAAA